MLRGLSVNAEELRQERQSSSHAEFQGRVARLVQLSLSGSDFLATEPNEPEHPRIPIQQLLGDRGQARQLHGESDHG